MNLTKGKITKLYSKKKQTLKKAKKKKSSPYKKRTFRNRKPVNLARGTLKKFKKGGSDNETNDSKDEINGQPENEEHLGDTMQETNDDIEEFNELKMEELNDDGEKNEPASIE